MMKKIPRRPRNQDIDRLVALDHHDPHSILGAHPGRGGVIIRAWRPDAESVRVLPEPGVGAPVTMKRVRREGLFEARFRDRSRVFPYRFEVNRPGGDRLSIRDPYVFLPTLGELDLHLHAEGTHERLYEKLGARIIEFEGVQGVAFAVWAPNARRVSVVGDWNGWDGRFHPMRMMGSSGIWELFIPELELGAHYKFEIRARHGTLFLKTDPYALSMEKPPGNAARIYRCTYRFEDGEWLQRRRARQPHREPVSIYEVHLGSWRRVPEEGNRPLTYAEAAERLADYVAEMGFTHVELMPIMEHPLDASWGYQVSGYYAPTSRFGTPDDFKRLIDRLHRRGIGVILDWVPAHFPKDEWGLGRFDGTALYEHLDPRQGEHPDWGTFIFNYGRNEVRNFLLGSALFWLENYHADGLRLDAVASMLYLDYSRRIGEWIPNPRGGRENLEAIEFLQQMNERVHGRYPGVIMAAEESTAWPGVSRPTYAGGLGFGFKWNMGWMHDTLDYFSKDPLYRRYHHQQLTFGLLYAFSENFILPLSHDEVVHGKGSLLRRMPGTRAAKLAGLRALFAYMWAHPGKKLLFMGGEFGQEAEWSHARSLDWHLLEDSGHRGVQALVRDLNRFYRKTPALWEGDSTPEGFRWIDLADADGNVLSFMRIAPSSGERMICVCNFSGEAKSGYRIGMPAPGTYREILNTDAVEYGGGGRGNLGSVRADPIPWHQQPASAELHLPPLSVLWLGQNL